MQCSNNLKQTGLAVHNFHDSQNGLVPLVITMNKGSYVCYLYPYAEQNALYEFLCNSSSIGAGFGYANAGSQFKDAATYTGSSTPLKGLLSFPNDMYADAWFQSAIVQDPGLKTTFGSVSSYHCPSSVSTHFWELTDENDFCGPTSGYIAVMTRPEEIIISGMGLYGIPADTDPKGRYTYKWDYCLLQENHYSGSDIDAAPDSYNGPLRPAGCAWINPQGLDSADSSYISTVGWGGYTYDPGNVAGTGSGSYKNFNSWSPRTDFAYWSDGTSNQFVFGEKHIPSFAMEAGAVANFSPASAKLSQWNGSSLFSWSGSVSTICRLIGPDTLVARGPGDNRIIHNQSFAEAGNYDYGFGSSHTSVVNFLIGDGSVHSISAETTPRILYGLGQVNDGVAVSLP